ncbi:MAG TPA: hypothetical protein VMT93_02655 [Gemmatimonadaceae bacterium]|nr:hypothetical protein [Gemmatimonadaceae bacterium]
MSAALATTVRARPGTIVLGAGHGAITCKVQLAERWDAVRVTAAASETVQGVKVAVLAALAPGADHRDFVMKLGGAERADSDTLMETGAVTGSTFLLSARRRRPAR